MALSQYQAFMISVRTIYREEWRRAFYSVMGTNMARAVPSSAMTLLSYECMCVNGLLLTFLDVTSKSNLSTVDIN
jgi:hypothetical protein